MKITLNQKEQDKINAVIDILEEYSRVWSELIKGKQGTFYNNAAIAAGMLKQLIENK